MDFIRYVKSKDIRQYLYDIEYKLSVEQIIFIVLSCSFINVDEKKKALEELQQSYEDTPLTSISDESYQETIGLTSHEFIRRYISDVKTMSEFMKADNSGYFYQAKIQYENASEPYLLGCFKSYAACFEALEKYSREKQMGPDECFRIDKISFDDDDSDSAENFVSDYSYCILSNKLELMDICVYDNNCRIYGVSRDGMYIGLPMPFKKGDIVTLGRDFYSIYLGYHPEKPEDFMPGRSCGDILFYGIDTDKDGFDYGYGSVFDYNLEYADPSKLSGDDLKLIPLSDLIKGKIEPDEFYRDVRVLDLKSLKAREEKYLSSYTHTLEALGLDF